MIDIYNKWFIFTLPRPRGGVDAWKWKWHVDNSIRWWKRWKEQWENLRAVPKKIVKTLSLNNHDIDFSVSDVNVLEIDWVHVFSDEIEINTL